MKKLFIDFVDFWPGFTKDNNYFFNLLSKYYDVSISDTPEYLFYSVNGTSYRAYDCIRIFYTPENIRPRFWECDYSLTFDFLNDSRNYRLPIYLLYSDVARLLAPKPDFETEFAKKTKFCNILVSNYYARKRIAFFEMLREYKPVDSGGRYMNNIGHPITDRLQFTRNYKFTIAFENASYPGYTTEKISEAMIAYSLPIYWGNRLVSRDFNTKSFLNWHEYKSDELLIQKIIELDNNKILYQKYYEQPFFVGNKVNDYIREDLIVKFFDRVFTTAKKPVAKTMRKNIVLLDGLFKVLDRCKKGVKRRFTQNEM
jgi:hypothetical protein